MAVALAALRQTYSERWEQVRREFVADDDAAAALSSLTDLTDELISRLAEQYQSREHFGLLAIGGYGRRELYPFSDVDLLLVYDSGRQAEAERQITSTLHDLWDSKLHVGHQVWSIESLTALRPDDYEFVLALLDGRTIGGDQQLGRLVLDEILPGFIRANAGALISRIVQSAEARHASFLNTIYQLEPDIKQAPGGLRDYLTGKWLLRLGDPLRFLPYSEAEIEAAHAGMARLRILLHFLRGREQNQLTHRMQEAIAAARGYGPESLPAGVESLMMEYFLNARILNSFCLRTLRQARGETNAVPELNIDPRLGLRTVPEILEIFRRSMREGRVLSDQARNAVADALPEVSRTLSFPELAPGLKELFKPRPGLYQALSAMYETGLLEMLFPEFGTIKARLIRDFYHKYTVDEHSLLAIKNIEDLITTSDRSDFRFRSLLLESSDAELLTMALLLHDIGKSREGSHVDRSTSMAAKALRRFQLGREEFETILFLIRNHIAMSAVVFRRDLDDPEVVERFVDLVNDPGRLRLLCLLTYADIKAVAPDTLNEWKKDLLWQLYVAAYNKLTLGFGEERIEEEDVSEKLLLDLPAELDADEFERFLEGLPRRYLTTVPAAEIYEHFRLASRLTPEDTVQLRLTGRNGYYELCAVTPDRYYLFAKIVGILSYFEMNILRGYGFSNRQNTVLDLFQFHDTRQVFNLNPEEKTRFLALVNHAIRDEVSAEKLLAGKEESVVFRPVGPPFAPTVHFEDEYSDAYSIVEIVAPDSIGLLYRIGREISSLQCNIELVLISTEGNKAVDVFYLTHRGGKLPSSLRERLGERIVAAIG